MRSQYNENYWLCRAALLIVLLPLFLGAFLAPSFGVVDILKRGIVLKGPVAIPIGYFMLTGYIAAFVLLMLKGRITRPLILIFASYLLLLFADLDGGSDHLQIVLEIGAGSHTVGKDVYCNDVFLGRTPLTISRKEFYEKVKPWPGPPRQQRMEIGLERDRDTMRYFQAQYYWIPYDVFDYYEGFSYFGTDRKQPLWGVHDDEKLLVFFKTAKYWWHFDKDGCVGLSRPTNFSGGSSGRGHLLTVSADPPFEIISVGKHFQVVLEDLRRKQFQPDPRWLEHFSTYQDLLFGPLHEFAAKNPEAEQVVEVFGNRNNVRRAIGMCAKVRNPALENDIRFFVANQTSAKGIGNDISARQFVESRIHRFKDDPNLPDWIQNYAPLEDVRKAELIARLHSRKILHPLNYLSSVNPRCRERALSVLTQEPNPYADEFLIASYRSCTSPSGPRHMPNDLVWAMLKLDTPKIHDFIRQTWDKGGPERKKLLEQMRSLYWYHPHLDWLVPKIEQLTDKDERNTGLRFLSRIGTDNAKALLAKWTKDPDEKIAKAAKWYLDRFGRDQKEDREDPVSQETIDRLLSGRIKPDDLLDPAQAYVWDGEKYVPDKKLE